MESSRLTTKTSRLALVALIASLATAQVALGSSTILGFQAWKARRVIEAQSLFQQVRTEVRMALSKAQNRSPQRARYLQERLEQARLNIQISRELTPNDYFVLYVRERRNTNPRAFVLAVEQMSNPEVAEILASYHQSLLRRELPSEGTVRVYRETDTAHRRGMGRPSRLERR